MSYNDLSHMSLTIKPIVSIPATVESRVAGGDTLLVSHQPDEKRFVAGLYGRFGTGATCYGNTAAEALVNLEMTLWGEQQ